MLIERKEIYSGRVIKVSVDTVGPTFGDQLRNNAIKALVLSLIVVLIFLAFRYDWRFWTLPEIRYRAAGCAEPAAAPSDPRIMRSPERRERSVIRLALMPRAR